MRKIPKIKKRSVIEDVQAKSKEGTSAKFKNVKNPMVPKARSFNI